MYVFWFNLTLYYISVLQFAMLKYNILNTNIKYTIQTTVHKFEDVFVFYIYFWRSSLILTEVAFIWLKRQ